MTDNRLDLRCSVLTGQLAERPAGTAGSWCRVILVELPLPWPDAIDEHPMLAGVHHAGVPGRPHRILALASALAPVEATPHDGLRVICYWRPVDAPFRAFSRAEVCAPEDGVGAIVDHLIAVSDDDLAAIPPDSFAAGAATVDQPVRDLLVCTHGTRDRCCGKFGTELFRGLDGHTPPGVRLWRTSHTGGHRFAPTGLTFPDGGTWARLDEAVSLGLIDRTVPVAEAAVRARGSAGIPPGPAQVADIEAFARSGWAWIDDERTVDVATGPTETVVTVDAKSGGYRVTLVEGRQVPVPACGSSLDAARKTTTEWDVVAVEPLD